MWKVFNAYTRGRNFLTSNFFGKELKTFSEKNQRFTFLGKNYRIDSFKSVNLNN